MRAQQVLLTPQEQRIEEQWEEVLTTEETPSEIKIKLLPDDTRIGLLNRDIEVV